MGRFSYKSSTQVSGNWGYKPTNTVNHNNNNNNHKSPYNHNNNRQYNTANYINNNYNGHNQQRYSPYAAHKPHTPRSIAAASRSNNNNNSSTVVQRSPVVKQQSPQHKLNNLATLDKLQHNLPADIKAVLTQSNELLPHTIRFVPAIRNESIKPNIISLPPPINPQFNNNDSSSATPIKSQATQSSTSLIIDENAFAEPAYYLFDPLQLNPYMKWTHHNRIGVGLHNMGNTCFLNATLQALAYIPVLQQYCVTQQHSTKCTYKQNNQICFFCLVESQLIKLHSSNNAMAPQLIAQSMRLLSRRFQIGRQEDSHELLRCLLDALEKSVLYKYGNTLTDQRVKETTVVAGLFGGYFRSQVQCQVCGYESNTYDQYLDLSLEVDRCSSVVTALKHFTAAERLDMQNLYKCKRCAPKRVPASKQLTIYRAPNVLCIHLKRFSMGNGLFSAGKLGKHIQFDTTLNIAPFMSNRNEQHYRYSLCGVLVHSGYSAHSGHYYSYVKSPNGAWYEMNDSSVRQSSESNVLTQQAYMLFYVRTEQIESNTNTPLSTPNKPLNNSTPIKSPVLNGVAHTNGINGVHTPTNDTTPTHPVPVRRRIAPTAAEPPTTNDGRLLTSHTTEHADIDTGEAQPRPPHKLSKEKLTDAQQPTLSADIIADAPPKQRRLSVNIDDNDNTINCSSIFTKSISTPIPVDNHIFVAPTSRSIQSPSSTLTPHNNPSISKGNASTAADSIVTAPTAYESHIVSPSAKSLKRARGDSNGNKRHMTYNSVSAALKQLFKRKKKESGENVSDVNSTDTGTESDQSNNSTRGKQITERITTNNITVKPADISKYTSKLVQYSSSDSDDSVDKLNDNTDSTITHDNQSIRSAVHQQYNLTPKRSLFTQSVPTTSNSTPSTPFYPRASTNQYGARVDSWDDTNISDKQQQQSITQAIRNENKLRVNGYIRDDYDLEYDKGRTRQYLFNLSTE